MIVDLHAAVSRLTALKHWNEVAEMPVHRAYQRLGCIFVHIPKTAGLAVSRALFGNDSQHRDLFQYRLIFGNRFVRNAFKFAFVRSPVDRFCSAFRYLQAGGMNDADRRLCDRWLLRDIDLNHFAYNFLESPELQGSMHFKPQWMWISNGKRVLVDFLGTQEHLSEGFAYVCERLGVEAHLKQVNQSDRSHEGTLAPDLLARVKDFYTADMRLHQLAAARRVRLSNTKT